MERFGAGGNHGLDIPIDSINVYKGCSQRKGWPKWYVNIPGNYVSCGMPNRWPSPIRFMGMPLWLGWCKMTPSHGWFIGWFIVGFTTNRWKTRGTSFQIFDHPPLGSSTEGSSMAFFGDAENFGADWCINQTGDVANKRCDMMWLYHYLITMGLDGFDLVMNRR